VILINLLPHREAARARRREAFNVQLVASALLGCVLIAMAYFWIDSQISSQQERNAFLGREIALLDSQIKEIANIETEIKALTERQKAVEDLLTSCGLAMRRFLQ
jgi:type IV pilus assembly protein PilN